MAKKTKSETEAFVIPSGWRIIDEEKEEVGSVEVVNETAQIKDQAGNRTNFYWVDIPALIRALELAYKQLSDEYGDE